MPEDPEVSSISVSELIAEIDLEIAAAKDRMATYDEAAAIRTEALDDGLTTDQRAVAALLRPERFAGEHQVAHAWLFNSSTARLWSKNGNGLQ